MYDGIFDVSMHKIQAVNCDLMIIVLSIFAQFVVLSVKQLKFFVEHNRFTPVVDLISV